MEMQRQATVRELQPFEVSEVEITNLVAFLNALTGVTAETRPMGRPDVVPSGLPVD